MEILDFEPKKSKMEVKWLFKDESGYASKLEEMKKKGWIVNLNLDNITVLTSK